MCVRVFSSLACIWEDLGGKRQKEKEKVKEGAEQVHLLGRLWLGSEPLGRDIQTHRKNFWLPW